MKIEKSKTGCLMIKQNIFRDKRGSFQELIKKSDMFAVSFAQENVSWSVGGVVRGMHFQKKNPQGKWVRVLSGSVIDVVLDLRKGSPTYGETENFKLSNDGGSLYVPPGFGHGFMALESTVFMYHCTEEYDPESDGGISPIDDAFDFPWKNEKNVIISEKDMNLPFLRDVELPFEYGGNTDA